MQTTRIDWRAVNVSPETKTYGAQCLGGPSLGRCAEPVAYCRQWQSSAMSGPAFWYFCAAHAADAAEVDGMALEPDAPGFADSPRSATVDGFSTPIQYSDSVQESDSDVSEDDKDINRRKGFPVDPFAAEEDFNPYAVGSIWHTSWGYDQTNVEYYTVVRESKASVWLVPMSTTVRDGRLYPGDPLQWSTDASLAPTPSMHRKPRKGYGLEHPYLHLDSVRTAWPYTGGGCYDTRAAGQPGH